jgi:hypothetical protein
MLALHKYLRERPKYNANARSCHRTEGPAHVQGLMLNRREMPAISGCGAFVQLAGAADDIPMRDGPRASIIMYTSATNIGRSVCPIAAGGADCYSQRSARIGSTKVALRAGTYPAKSATAAIARVAAAMVNGSFGSIP